jgi:hypothetical protein
MTTQTEFNAALKIAIEVVNTLGCKAVRADEVRAYGWPRSDLITWSSMVAAAGVRTLQCNGETYLVV